MKTLMLLRHGKSDWDHDVEDHERPLAPRGIDAAGRVGEFLARLKQVPDRVVSSSAVRARETARLAAAAGSWEPAVELDGSLYETSARAMVEWLQRLPNSTGSILLVGHQPTWSQLAGALIGGGHLRFPTAALVRIDLHVDSWPEVEFGCGELVWFELPRVLKGIGWP